MPVIGFALAKWCTKKYAHNLFAINDEKSRKNHHS